MTERRVIFCLLFLIVLSLATDHSCPAKETPESPAVNDKSDAAEPLLFNKKDWELPSTESVSNGGKTLRLRKSNGAERATTNVKYRRATLEFEARFANFDPGVKYYLGFMSRDPWAQHVIWLISERNRFSLQTAQGGNSRFVPGSATDELEINRWYPVRLEWKKGAVDRLERRSDRVTLTFDGNVLGTFGNLETMPETMIRVVFDAVSQVSSEAAVDIRNVKITPHGDLARQATLSLDVPLPPAANLLDKTLALENASARVHDNKATLANGFLVCDIDLNALQITRLVNKYTNSEMIHAGSRLFVMNAQGEDIPNSDYQLLDTQAISNADLSVVCARWKSAQAALHIDLQIALAKDSQEITLSLEAKNLGDKLLTLGITNPFLENIRIGESVEDDWYFFPMMSGWCGKLPVRLRHAYGYMACMQWLAVFDPVVGGGVFTYSRDDTGMPRNLLVNKREKADEDPASHNTSGFAEEDPGEIFNRLPGSAMAVRHMRYELEAGQSARLPDAVLGISHGDWHDGFNHYKQWVHTWFKKAYRAPQWFMDNYEYISQHDKGGSWPSSGFMDKAEDRYVFAERMGDSEVGAMTEWAYWWDNPQERRDSVPSEYSITRNGHGDYDYNDRRGGLEAFREEISRIHEKGGRVQLYMLAVGCSDDSRIGKAHGAEWGRMSSSGNYTTDWIMPGRGYNGCMYVDGWQQHISGRMSTILRETGADAYRLDVASLLYQCYNPGHAHYDGSIRSTVSSKQMGRLLVRSSREARQANPQAALMTEHAGNEYLAQYIDGYLTQQFWLDTPFFGDLRGLNGYNLVFMRFLIPQVKVILFGFEPADGGRRAFFNAVGQDRGGARGEILEYLVRSQRVLIENGDAVHTLNPEPMIPTLQPGLMANAFPGSTKRLWTLQNRLDTPIAGDLLAVDTRKNVHYVEMFHDVSLTGKPRGGKTIISGRLEPREVICIAELPKALQAELAGQTLSVTVKQPQADMRVDCYVGPDDREKAINLPLREGKGSIRVSGKDKIIVKLFQGSYLLDQAILPQ